MDSRPPVAIRILRPHADADAFLAADRGLFGRSTVSLPGAAQKPVGAVITFEIALADGSPLVRGEGRVLSNGPLGPGLEPGLVLRLARVDADSRALLERIVSARSGAPPNAAPHDSGAEPQASNEGSPTDPAELAETGNSVPPSEHPTAAPEPRPEVEISHLTPSDPANLSPEGVAGSNVPPSLIQTVERQAPLPELAGTEPPPTAPFSPESHLLGRPPKVVKPELVEQDDADTGEMQAAVELPPPPPAQEISSRDAALQRLRERLPKGR